jgi:outer membrane protein assembly factor BamD (BamD/ComL family)
METIPVEGRRPQANGQPKERDLRVLPPRLRPAPVGLRPSPPGLWPLAFGLLVLAGCQGGGGPLSRWRMAHDDGLAPGVRREELGDTRGMTARWLTPERAPHTEPGRAPGFVLGPEGWKPRIEKPDPAAEAEFAAAEALFQQGRLPEAERAFARIARRRKETRLGEKAQFYLAETQYQRGRYVAAHDSFETLIATYPGTQYLDKMIGREYDIARTWLADAATDPDRTLPWTARFNGGLPVLDVGGNSLAVLEHVRHHDPTGPLADDAVLRIADYHYAGRDFETAAVYYDQLITDHPKSPLLHRAQLASIDAKLKAYIGPEYDGAGLEQARDTVQQTMATFPERQAATGGDLYHTLDLIADQQAERTYSVGRYYRRAGKVASAEYYFGMIPRRWPKSPWADKAKVQLAELAKLPRTESLPSKIFTQPGSGDPYSNGVTAGNPNGFGGAGGP